MKTVNNSIVKTGSAGKITCQQQKTTCQYKHIYKRKSSCYNIFAKPEERRQRRENQDGDSAGR